MTTALQPLPGVVEVKADPASKTAVCKVNPDEFDSKAVLDKLASIKYPGTIAETN